jgi:FkbM family methyltransferase
VLYHSPVSFLSSLPYRLRSRLRRAGVFLDINVRVPLRFIAAVTNWPLYFSHKKHSGEVTYRLRNGFLFSVPADTTDINPFTDIWFRGVYDAPGIAFDQAKTVIDVGGHIGAFTLYVASHSPEARIYTLEPEPQSFAYLQKNVVQNNLADRVTCIQAGVGGQEGTMELHVVPGRGEGNSVYRAPEGSTTLSIDVVRLQDLFDREKIEHCDILKMNAEGVEYEIFYGLPAEYFAKISAIVMNYHVFVPHPDATPDKLRSHLEKHGFTVHEQGKRIFVAVR